MHPIPYGRQTITDEDVTAVTKTLRAEFLTKGPMVDEFEKAFARYVGAKYAVAVANGTAALHLAAMALGMKPGQKAITTPITFSGTANCVRYCGGDIVFCDIDPETFLLDLKQLRTLLASAPKGTYQGILPVDLAGLPTHMQELRTIADQYNLWIIADACHAPGAKINGVYACGDGKFADLTVFSFHPVKHITCGEGGMITTNRHDLYQKLCRLRDHGIVRDPAHLSQNPGGWYYELHELGYNYRLTDIHCALGLSQLQRAPQNLARRQEIARIYDEAFHGTAIKTPFVPDQYLHAYHLYIIQVENRLEVYNHLCKKNIFPQVHYIPIHLLDYYKKLGWKHGDFPRAEKYYEHCLSLPMFPNLTEAEQNHVINAVLEVA